MELIVFNHKLYGRALLLPNQSFIVTDKPKLINYVLLGTMEDKLEVKISGIYDAGLEDNRDILSSLKELGY